MLYGKALKKTTAMQKKAVERYDQEYKQFMKDCEKLYNKRNESVEDIESIEALINSIANTPKELKKELSTIKNEKEKFTTTIEIARESYQNVIKARNGMAVGVLSGGTLAVATPTAAMWVATTFGTASTGTAIASLSGAAASNAALAWLGGGALASGGGGMVIGQAWLALAGPIGWSIAGVGVIASVGTLGFKNKKQSEEIMDEIRNILRATFKTKENHEYTNDIYDKTVMIKEKVSEQQAIATSLAGKNYSKLSNTEQLLLGTLVNNTLSLSELLNKTIEDKEVSENE